MHIDPDVAIGAQLPDREISWSSSDVLLYHLALGAGGDELRYVYERDLQALPTFAVVVGMLRDTEPPTMAAPGIDVDLVAALHGREELTIHRPLPVEGRAIVRSRIVDVQDKGSAAVIVRESSTEFFTTRTSIFVKGAGGFGGERGPSTRVATPDRAPDTVLLTATSPQQAAWYRLLGDRNPLHIDPQFAAKAGFPGPILHGLCTYGMVCKAVVDAVLDGDPARVVDYSTRFAGVIFPGETLRTRVWREGQQLVLLTSVVERGDGPVLSDTVLTVRDR